MGTITNVGDQKIFFNYHKELTGANMNEFQQERTPPGIIKDMVVTKQTDSSILLGTGVFGISDGTNTVMVRKDSPNAMSVVDTKPYIVGRYTYNTIEDWYVEFLNVTTPVANDVIFGKINFVSGDVDSIDYSENDNSWKRFDYDLFVTASGHNAYFKDLIESGVFGPAASGNRWLDLMTESWFEETDNAPIENFIGTKIPSLVWDQTIDRYFYFYLRTGAVVDIDFRLKFSGNNGAGGNVKLKLEYKLLSNGLTNLDTLAFSDSTEEVVTMAPAVYTYQELTTTTLIIPSAVSAISNKLILCRLSRDYGDASDTYPGNFELIQMLPNT